MYKAEEELKQEVFDNAMKELRQILERVIKYIKEIVDFFSSPEINSLITSLASWYGVDSGTDNYIT